MAAKLSRFYGAWRSAAQGALGILAVALLTFVGFRLQTSAATAALLYLLAVLLTSLWASLAVSVLVSVVAILSLDYFFTPPLFRISISDPIDVVAAFAFATTAVVITRLLAKLRKSEEQWRDVFENNPTMYFIVDPAGTVLSVNPFGAEQLGYAVDELVGQPVLRVFYEADRDAVQRHVADCLAHVGQTKSWELRKVRKDGSMLWVRETAKAVLRAPKQLIVLVACENITERKRAEEALREARDELARVVRLTTMGELAASIAHEIRQPLAAIVISGAATLRWLNREKPDLDEARDGVAQIVRDAGRAEEVIRGLRTLAQKSGPRLSSLDLTDTIQEVLTLTQSELQRQGMSVRTELDPNGRRVVGDRVQLQQVLLNLLMNGVEAMSAVADGSKVLTIRSEPAGAGEVVVSVEDTGPGLDPASADRVFNPFFTTKPNGLGMGLSICRSIVDAHGGRLWAEPRSPRGTVFRFTVPAAA
jgi:PAS domain S-box-containing protein